MYNVLGFTKLPQILKEVLSTGRPIGQVESRGINRSEAYAEFKNGGEDTRRTHGQRHYPKHGLCSCPVGYMSNGLLKTSEKTKSVLCCL